MRVSRGTLITFTLWFAVSNMMSKPHRSTSKPYPCRQQQSVYFPALTSGLSGASAGAVSCSSELSGREAGCRQKRECSKPEEAGRGHCPEFKEAESSYNYGQKRQSYKEKNRLFLLWLRVFSFNIVQTAVELRSH